MDVGFFKSKMGTESGKKSFSTVSAFNRLLNVNIPRSSTKIRSKSTDILKDFNRFLQLVEDALGTLEVVGINDEDYTRRATNGREEEYNF